MTVHLPNFFFHESNTHSHLTLWTWILDSMDYFYFVKVETHWDGGIYDPLPNDFFFMWEHQPREGGAG